MGMAMEKSGPLRFPTIDQRLMLPFRGEIGSIKGVK